MITIHEADVAVKKIAVLQLELKRLFGRPVKVMFQFLDVSDMNVAQVLAAVENVTGIPTEVMISADRHRHVAEARQHCYHLMRRYLQMTFEAIGKVFNRDHSTVMYGIEAFDALYKTETQYRETYDQITKVLLHESNVEADA